MGGFAGIHGPRPDQDLVEQMCRTLVHRGPGSMGVVGDQRIAMGVCQTIDRQGDCGRGPWRSRRGDVLLAWDGAILNHEELRKRLSQQGCIPADRSDMALAVDLYLILGPNFVSSLEGMFAFALWERGRQRLVLARDHLGIKPLVYRIDGERVHFASEVKALLQDTRFARRANMPAIADLLGHFHLSGDETFFEGINSLPPGHMMVVDGSGVRLEQYWDLTFAEGEFADEAEAVEQFGVLLGSSVARHLSGDHPTGLALSGGIDSAAIAAFAGKASGSSKLRSYTLGYDQGRADGAARSVRSPHAGERCEATRAAYLASYLGTKHSEFVVGAQDVLDAIPDVVRRFDAPHTSSFAPFLLARHIDGDVSKLVSGLGADELLGGYGRSRDMECRVGSHLNEVRVRHATRCHFMLDAHLSIAQQAELFRPDVLESIDLNRCAPRVHEARLAKQMGMHLADCCLYLDFKTQIANEYLPTTDLSFMGAGIEVGMPFLDLRLVEFVLSLPLALRSHAPLPKYVLRKAIAALLPDGYLDLPKTGFSLPIAEWMDGPLWAWADDLLASETTRRRGWFDPEVVELIRGQHRQGIRRPELLWTLAMIEAWASIYLDGSNQVKHGCPAGRTSPATSTYPVVKVAPSLDRHECRNLSHCSETHERNHKLLLGSYIGVDGPAAGQTVAAWLDLRDLEFVDYLAALRRKHKGSALRHARKADERGYFCQRFPYELHIPDIAAINHSKEVRTGGIMTAPYRRSIEELGGAPKEPIALQPPSCPVHYDCWWGIFLPDKGNRQGDVTVDKRLLGYLLLRRHGNYGIYSKILGHGDHLRDGIMYRLHLAVIEWLCNKEEEAARGMEHLVYAGFYQGAPGLRQWKNKTLFRPALLVVTGDQNR